MVLSALTPIRNQLIDRRGFITRTLAAGAGLIVPQIPLIPAFGQNLGCVTSSPYVTRPPWKVAGVDYCVGIQSALVLKDPRTITGSTIRGVDAFGTNAGDSRIGQINISLNDLSPTTGNVIFDGWHFHNCQLLDFGSNCNSVTFRNCLFEWDATFDNDSIGIEFIHGKIKFLTVEHCEFGHMLSSEGTIDWASGENLTRPAYDGGLTVRWTYFNNCPGDGINQKSGGDTHLLYNVFLNQADGGKQGHADQFTLEQGTDRHFKNTIIAFNTVFDDSFFECGDGTQGFTLQGNNHRADRIITDGGSVDHNTWVNVTTGCPGDVLAGVFYGPCIDISDTTNGKQWCVTNNYVDDIGFTRVGTTNLEWLRTQNNFIDPLGGTVLSGNNTDLRTNTQPARYNRGLQNTSNIPNDGA